jgi:hypothetical protein
MRAIETIMDVKDNGKFVLQFLRYVNQVIYKVITIKFGKK